MRHRPTEHTVRQMMRRQRRFERALTDRQLAFEQAVAEARAGDIAALEAWLKATKAEIERAFRTSPAIRGSAARR